MTLWGSNTMADQREYGGECCRELRSKKGDTKQGRRVETAQCGDSEITQQDPQPISPSFYKDKQSVTLKHVGDTRGSDAYCRVLLYSPSLGNKHHFVAVMKQRFNIDTDFYKIFFIKLFLSDKITQTTICV